MHFRGLPTTTHLPLTLSGGRKASSTEKTTEEEEGQVGGDGQAHSFRLCSKKKTFSHKTLHGLEGQNLLL